MNTRRLINCVRQYPWLPIVIILAVFLLVSREGSVLSRLLNKHFPVKVAGPIKTRPENIRSAMTPNPETVEPMVSKQKEIPTCKEAVKENILTKNESTERPLKLVSGFGTKIVLLSAIVGNSTANTTWDKIAFSGWEAMSLINQTYACCVAYSSGVIKSFPVKRVSRGSDCAMKSRHYVCTTNETNLNDKPVAATLTDATKPDCHIFTANYLESEYAYSHPGEIAVFGKVIYGNVSARDLVAWIEINKHQGVNKIVLYPNQLSNDAMRVLRYYRDIGLLEIVYFSRHTTVPMKKVGQYQHWNDKEVSEYDGLARLRGYKYLVNYDIDELILSRKGESWMTLFDRLFNSTKDGAAYWFRSYIFVKSWGPTNDASTFMYARYTLRTNITSDTSKLVVDPSKLEDAGLSTHYDNLIKGYKTYGVNHEDAAIHHFRECRPEWLHNGTRYPCYNVTRNQDDFVLNWFKKVEKDVMYVVTKLDI